MLTQQMTNVTIFRQGWVRVGKSTMKSHSIVTHRLEKDSISFLQTELHDPANRSKFTQNSRVGSVCNDQSHLPLPTSLPLESICYYPENKFGCLFLSSSSFPNKTTIY